MGFAGFANLLTAYTGYTKNFFTKNTIQKFFRKSKTEKVYFFNFAKRKPLFTLFYLIPNLRRIISLRTQYCLKIFAKLFPSLLKKLFCRNFVTFFLNHQL